MNRRELLKSSLLAAGQPRCRKRRHRPAAARNRALIVGRPLLERLAAGKCRTCCGSLPTSSVSTRFRGLNNDHIHTPNLQKLMGESVTFTHAFVQNPVCSPSRASFFHGRYPHTTGLRANGQRIRRTSTWLRESWANNGYTCGLSGKLHFHPAPAGGKKIVSTTATAYSGGATTLSDQWPGKNMWHVWLKDKGVKWPVASA